MCASWLLPLRDINSFKNPKSRALPFNPPKDFVLWNPKNWVCKGQSPLLEVLRGPRKCIICGVESGALHHANPIKFSFGYGILVQGILGDRVPPWRRHHEGQGAISRIG